MQCKLNINNFLDIKCRLFANMYQIKKYVVESLPTRAVILSSAVMPPPRGATVVTHYCQNSQLFAQKLLALSI